MITHHPKFELIHSFVKGDLPASISAGIAMHAELCPQCQHQIAQLTDQMAEASFEESSTSDVTALCSDSQDATTEGYFASLNADDMIASITQSDDLFEAKPQPQQTVTLSDQSYVLPKALNSMEVGKSASIGRLSRARIHLDENEIRTSLLQMQPGGSVPEHTHKGFELTLLLDGSFSDEKGKYVKGDFIVLDRSHQHHPVSEEGCLCYTVVNDALHFTQGINKLLNPIGSLIY
ncbi:ChrR family anti-sigma-E factor [uncultured Paraglaciecola sp.]|uniref:ChrR family anti-sigma-E factor n=1 Tax=uncultured Paraglaciecola sp. TaxID=1765024 RepID=UPI00262421ED|nr:ChrR family anti-sigma-E factor [uncultured Paraglaciecola sp.]